MILSTCRATIGQVGNLQHELVNVGKAGRSRWKGVRPTVRGSVMNLMITTRWWWRSCSIGRPSPMSPWGKPTLGKKTRRKNLLTNLSFVDVRKIILKLIWVCGVKLHAHNKKGGAQMARSIKRTFRR